jgi:hypothetical protein
MYNFKIVIAGPANSIHNYKKTKGKILNCNVCIFLKQQCLLDSCVNNINNLIAFISFKDFRKIILFSKSSLQ